MQRDEIGLHHYGFEGIRTLDLMLRKQLHYPCYATNPLEIEF